MKSKKVFVMKNFKSPYIEEAIFILREDAPSGAARADAVLEAERIVTGYLEGLSVPCPPKIKKRRHIALSLLAVCMASIVWLLLR